jgi:ribosome-associated translation inhibitor RaiA
MSNKQKHEKMNTQIETTFGIIAQLTNDFKNSYMEICENWYNTEFHKNIEFIEEFKNECEPHVDKYGKINRDLDFNIRWKLEQMNKKFQNIDGDIHYCARLLKSTPEKFDTRMFASFDQIQTKIETLKSTWIAKQMKKTSKSFDQSLLKITGAIAQSQMNVDAMEIRQIQINNGIDITLVDGEKCIHAFTIIAMGEIVKPHYRFLIKNIKNKK